MAFLRLNGYTVPVAKGGEVEPLEIGDRTRAYDGTLLVDRRALKRVWRFVTTPVTELIGNMIKGLLQGQGDYWPFTGIGSLEFFASNLGFTSKGMAPIAGFVTTLLDSTSPDGYAIYDQNGVLYEGNRGNAIDVRGHAVAIDASTTNQLTAVQARGAGGYTADNGADVTGVDSGVHFMQGATSLKVVCAAVVDSGFHMDIVAINGRFYTFSAYIWCATAETVRIAMTTPGVLIAQTDVVVPANAWRRISVSGAATATLTVRCIINNAGVASAITFWADAMIIEDRGSAVASYPTSWVGGTLTRAAGQLHYPAQIVTSDDFTLALWTKGPQRVLSATKVLATIAVGVDTGSQDYHYFFASGTNNEINWTSYHAATGTGTTLTYSSLWTNAWRHLCFVCRTNAETGEAKKSIYLDGVLVASQSPTNMPAIANVTTKFGFDYFNSASFPWDGVIDNVTYFPFASDANMAAAIYVNDQSKIYPALLADGDLMPESGATVVGKVTKVNYVGTQQGGAWRNNAVAIEFDLEEV